MMLRSEVLFSIISPASASEYYHGCHVSVPYLTVWPMSNKQPYAQKTLTTVSSFANCVCCTGLYDFIYFVVCLCR